MEKFNERRRCRKVVRFDLPEPIENQHHNNHTNNQFNANKPKEHETLTYVNGTLVNITSKNQNTNSYMKSKTSTTNNYITTNNCSNSSSNNYKTLLPVSVRILPSVSCLKPISTTTSTTNYRSFDVNQQNYQIYHHQNDIDYRKRYHHHPTTNPTEPLSSILSASASNSSPIQTYNQYITNNTATVVSTNQNKDSSKFGLPLGTTILKKFKKTNTHHNIDQLKAKHIVVIDSTPQLSTEIHCNNHTNNLIEDSIKLSDRFSRFRIFEDILSRKRKALKLSEKADRKVFYLKPLHTQIPAASEMGGMKRYLFCEENHTNLVADLIQRWSRIRLREETQIKLNTDKITTQRDPLETSVSFRNFKSSDVVKRKPLFQWFNKKNNQ